MIRSALIYAGSYVLMRSASFLVLPYVARMLGPVEFGKLDLLVTITQLAGLLATFGVVEAVLRFGSGARNTQDSNPMDPGAAMANGLALTLISAGLFLITALALTPWLVQYLPGEQEIGLMNLALLGGVASAWAALPTMIFRMHDQAMRYAGFMVVQALLQAGGNLLAVSLGFGVFGIMFTSATVLCLMGIYAIIAMARESGLSLEWPVARRLLIYGLPILGSAIAAFMMNGMERWFLADHVDAETFGSYAAAVKLFVLCVIAFQPFMLWWSAQRYRLLNAQDGEQNLVRYASIGIVFLLLLCTAISVSNPILVRFLFGAQYTVPAWWVSGLVLVMAVRATGDLTSIGIFSGQTSHKQMLAQYAAAGVTLLGLYTLIPSLGVLGLLLALLAGAGLRLLLFYIWSQRIRPLPYPMTMILALFAVYGASSLWADLRLEGAGALSIIGATLLVLFALLGVAYVTGHRVLLPNGLPWPRRHSA